MDAQRPAADRPTVMTLTQAAEYLQVSKAHLSNVINGKVRGIAPVRSFRPPGRRVPPFAGSGSMRVL